MIAILVNSLGAGGAERGMVNLAGALAARGRRTVLIVVREEGPLRALVSPDVEVIDLRAPRVAAALPALVEILRRERPRVLLSACANSNVVAVLAVGLARTGTRTVVSEQTTLSRVVLDTQRIRHRLVPHAARWAYPRADAVLAVSHGVANDLVGTLGVPRSKVAVVPNPLTPSIEVDARQAPDHPWLRDGGPPVLLSVARLTSAKDVPTLLHAFSRLRERHRSRLVVLGEGEERRPLERLIHRLGRNEDVDLAGFTPNPYSAIAAAHALVLSSRREGLPTVLLEALALGTPVVATDCASGPREILEDGRLGRLVPPRDPVALSHAMEAALVDGSASAQRYVLERYSLERITNRYLEVLDPASAQSPDERIAA